MQREKVIAALDAAIAELEQTRRALTGTAVKRGPGRPKKEPATPAARNSRHLSLEVRERIAAAQRKRWAKAKRAAKKAPK